MPVTKADSSDAKNKHAPATSLGSHSRPSGTFEMNLLLFPGVSGMPENASNLNGGTFSSNSPPFSLGTHSQASPTE